MSTTLPIVAVVAHCIECDRPILVERVLAGADHDVYVGVNCWDCLTEDQRRDALARYGLSIPMIPSQNKRA